MGNELVVLGIIFYVQREFKKGTEEVSEWAIIGDTLQLVYKAVVVKFIVLLQFCYLLFILYSFALID